MFPTRIVAADKAAFGDFPVETSVEIVTSASTMARTRQLTNYMKWKGGGAFCASKGWLCISC